jgi:hypothetical protein
LRCLLCFVFSSFRFWVAWFVEWHWCIICFWFPGAFVWGVFCELLPGLLVQPELDVVVWRAGLRP